MDAVCINPETVPSEDDVEALYDKLFGPPALDAAKDEAEERDEFDAYALVYEIAKERPALARQAARDGTAAHYRDDHPFHYSTDPSPEHGEAAQ
ncbi:hypothetical protein GGQ03_002348 [Salinibacter ruber]|nr:hypothetical protein [Salinibacter ruber]